MRAPAPSSCRRTISDSVPGIAGLRSAGGTGTRVR